MKWHQMAGAIEELVDRDLLVDNAAHVVRELGLEDVEQAAAWLVWGAFVVEQVVEPPTYPEAFASRYANALDAVNMLPDLPDRKERRELWYGARALSSELDAEDLVSGREFVRRLQTRTSPDPLLEIFEDFIDRQGRVDAAESDLRNTVAEKHQAIKRAAQPYEEAIKHQETRLAVLREQMAPYTIIDQLRAIDMPPITRQALDLLLQRHSMGINDFADQMLDDIKSSNVDGSLVQRIRAELHAFERLRAELSTDGGAEVAVVHLSWQEAVDTQAEFEGKKSNTGQYQKYCTVLYGNVSIDDLVVVEEDQSNGNSLVPLNRPVAIDLVMSNFKGINTEYYWGFGEAAPVEPNRPVSVRLVTGAKNDHQNLPMQTYLLRTAVDWQASAELRFSMRESSGFNSTQAKPKTFICTNNAAKTALELLSGDDAIPESVREQIGKLLT